MDLPEMNERTEVTARRTSELFKEQQQNIIRHTDRVFVRLMIWQWVAGVAAAVLLSPQAWSGTQLMSALLIHLTGGRIETHFHVFGSLAILAFYRDWRVLISASAVVYVDHLLRGMLWPQSVYGVLAAPVWRSLEHAGWVIFEVTF